MQDIRDGMLYRGDIEVSISTSNKKKKIIKTHNAGGELLFDFLAKCLCGLYSVNNKPNYFNMYIAVTSGSQTNYKSVLQNVIQIQSDYDSANKEAVMQVAFTKTNLASNISQGKKTYILALLSNNDSTSYGDAMATANLDIDLGSIEEGVTVLIKWHMKFKNEVTQNG